MNRNRKLRKQMMSGLAVGMAAVMGAAPVYAATGEDAAVSKEETVYVNANADGSEDQITVSNWLKIFWKIKALLLKCYPMQIEKKIQMEL